MPLVPLNPAPGVWRNGTQYQAKNRWFDANLVRQFERVIRPMYGWTAFSTTPVTGKARAILPWLDSAALFWVAVGCTSKLYVYDTSGAQYDITPAGLATGVDDAAIAAGYGGGAYGAGTYGTPRAGGTTLTDATMWTLDNLEQYLVGTNATDGKIYKWDLVTTNVATQCAGSPTQCRAVFVTQEAFIMALGAGGDPRKVQWADQDSFTSWTPATTNQARSYALQTPGKIMCGRRVRGAALIFCTTDVHLATYIGLPGVYSFAQIGTGCGIVSQQAHATNGEGVCAWMGQTGFWLFDGDVKPLSSDVGDYVLKNLNQTQRSKVFAKHDATFGEFQWFYPSIAGTEIDSYVIYNYREQHWMIGSMTRTCGAEAGYLTTPLMVDASGNLWQHESGLTYSGGGTIYIESGPLELNQGDSVYDVVGIYPDGVTLGDVTGTFYSRFYPVQADVAYGPYSMSNPTNVRVPGRELRLRCVFATGTDGRLGVPRLDVRSTGGLR